MLVFTSKCKYSIGKVSNAGGMQHVPHCPGTDPIIVIPQYGESRNRCCQRTQSFDKTLYGLLRCIFEVLSDQEIAGDQQDIRFLSADQVGNTLETFRIHPAAHVNITDLDNAQTGESVREPW